MKKIGIIVTLCILLLCSLQISATENFSTQQAAPEYGIRSSQDDVAVGQNNYTELEDSTNLISQATLSIYLESNRILRIVAYTLCTDVFDTVGFKDITIQRWINGAWSNVSVWSAYQNNTSSYLYDYSTTVTGGYYYRVTLTHYAKEGWWIFADTQEIYNETSYLWIE